MGQLNTFWVVALATGRRQLRIKHGEAKHIYFFVGVYAVFLCRIRYCFACLVQYRPIFQFFIIKLN